MGDRWKNGKIGGKRIGKGIRESMEQKKRRGRGWDEEGKMDGKGLEEEEEQKGR